jgi:hypothetical protein
MTDPSMYNTSIRREEATSLHLELVSRLYQRGLRVDDTAPSDQLADLLSAVDEFDTAVKDAGGDLFVNTPYSSEPERPEFVVPHLHDDESVKTYIKRVRDATERVRHLEQ